MNVDLPTLQQLLSDEIKDINDDDLRARVSSLLVTPTLMRCAWDYGDPGETYPCWKVAGDRDVSAVGIAYCESGFGPRCPWGLIWLNEAVPSMGMDCSWYPSFREAAADILDVSPASLNVR